MVQLRLEPPYELSEAAVDEALAGPPRRRVRLLAEQPDRQRPTARGDRLARIAHERARDRGRGIRRVRRRERLEARRRPPERRRGAHLLEGVRDGRARARLRADEPEVVADLQRVRLPYHLSSLTQAAGIVALRHTRAKRRRCSTRSGRNATASSANSRDRRRDGLPDRGELRAVRAAATPRREGGLAGAARSRRARARPDGGGAERAARHRRRGARGRPVPDEPPGGAVRDEPHRDGHSDHEGDRHHRRAEPRRCGLEQRPTPASRSSTTCCSSSASTPAGTSTSRARATCRSTATTPSRTAASRSAPALAEALGDKAGIRRFASITVPLDEAAVEVCPRSRGAELRRARGARAVRDDRRLRHRACSRTSCARSRRPRT